MLESVRKRTKVLGNGLSVVESTGWKKLGAWAVDFGLVAVLAAVACISVLGAGVGTAGTALASAAAVWILAPWLYGFCCPGGISLGSLATDTRLARFDTGKRPGFWRAGWVMFARMVLFPVVILIALLAAAGGSSPTGNGPKTRHITLDRRFPMLPAHLLPGPAIAVGGRASAERASAERAAAERVARHHSAAQHARMPGLYDQEQPRG